MAGDSNSITDEDKIRYYTALVVHKDFEDKVAEEIKLAKGITQSMYLKLTSHVRHKIKDEIFEMKKYRVPGFMRLWNTYSSINPEHTLNYTKNNFVRFIEGVMEYGFEMQEQKPIEKISPLKKYSYENAILSQYKLALLPVEVSLNSSKGMWMNELSYHKNIKVSEGMIFERPSKLNCFVPEQLDLDNIKTYDLMSFTSSQKKA